MARRSNVAALDDPEDTRTDLHQHADRGVVHAVGMRRWEPPKTAEGSAVVLGGGGATGIAWMAGLVHGLADLGIDLREADTIVGTSAGSVVGANMRAGTTLEGGLQRLVNADVAIPQKAFGPGDAGRFLIAQAIPGDRRGRVLLGRAALRATEHGRTASEADWVATIGGALLGKPWPEARLLLTAVHARTGQSVVFDADSGVPLELAMAASCAVPAIYPPVWIHGEPYVDGGVRTVTNADLGAGHERVVCIAPIPQALRRRDRPWELLRRLGPQVRSLVVTPDAASQRAIGRDVLDITRADAAAEAGNVQAARVLATLRDVWV